MVFASGVAIKSYSACVPDQNAILLFALVSFTPATKLFKAATSFAPTYAFDALTSTLSIEVPALSRT